MRWREGKRREERGERRGRSEEEGEGRRERGEAWEGKRGGIVE